MNEWISGPLPDDEVFVPYADGLRVEMSKITGYLLNLEHCIGGAKAQYFIARGFSVEDWEVFAGALRNHAKHNRVVSIRESEYGSKYVVDCTIATPNGDDWCLRAVWIDHGDDLGPRLVTAHPLRNRGT